MKKTIAVAVVLIMCMVLMSSCHTVKGVGEDIQGGGRAIEKSSGK